MPRELVKVFAAFSPVGEGCFEALQQTAGAALGCDEPWLFREGDMVCIAFQGLWFPLEETLAALREHLAPETAGKLDYLDLETWTLTRCVWRHGAFDRVIRDLNHVLAYSGH